MTNLDKYYDIMNRYKSGEFGNENLSMHEILDKANAPHLIEEMNLNEIQHLIDSTSGLTKNMFLLIKQERQK